MVPSLGGVCEYVLLLGGAEALHEGLGRFGDPLAAPNLGQRPAEWWDLR